MVAVSHDTDVPFEDEDVIRVPASAISLVEPDDWDYQPGDNGNRYSPRFKALVFQVWAFECDRIAVDTARYIKDEHGIEVASETIRRWAKAEGWSAAADEALRSIAPDLHAASLARLVRAKPMAIRTLVDVVEHMDRGKPSMPQMLALQLLLERAESATAPAPPVSAESIAGKKPAELARLVAERIRNDRDPV